MATKVAVRLERMREILERTEVIRRELTNLDEELDGLIIEGREKEEGKEEERDHLDLRELNPQYIKTAKQ